MHLEYKEDWDQAAKRLEAWWQGELLDRVVIQVTAPRDDARGGSGWTGWNLPQTPDDPDPAIDAFEASCRDTWFGGESFPNLWINLGPGIVAAFLGAEPEVAPDTVWFETEERPWDRILREAVYDPDNLWWRRARAITARAVERGRDQYIVGMTDLGGELDVLASLRGTENLLVDLVQEPEKVRIMADRLNDLWIRYHDELHEIIAAKQRGSSSWMWIWSPGTSYPLQCDFAAMISPAMFEEYVAPYLQKQCRRLDHTIYHLDGPGQIAHLDVLLSIPELDGIQWIPGAGAPGLGSPEWFPMYHRIQEAGKRLTLQWMPAEDVEPVMRELSSRGLLITTSCRSEEEGRELLRNAARWTHE